MSQGEHAHQALKQSYGTSNKKDFQNQFGKQERRETILRRQHDQSQLAGKADDEVNCSAQLHHYMSSHAGKSNVFSLAKLLHEHSEDPAVTVCPNLLLE
jgi:hypothetical protein